LAAAAGVLVIGGGGATASGSPHHRGPSEHSCPVFPSSNPLNQEIAHAPVDPNSARYIASIGLGAHLHPDFGTEPNYGIPYTVVGSSQPKVPIKFSEFGEESNPGPYPIPPNAPVEGAGEAQAIGVADNGSPWYITGAPDPRWNDEDLEQIKRVPGSAFEAVYTGPIRRHE
jgi:hypothetical protein